MPHPIGGTLKALVTLGKTADACWHWNGQINNEGVAIKRFDGRSTPARRWVWQMFFRPITPGYIITNSCQNKACVNPWHLRMCMQADANRGSVTTILLPADVIEIKKHRKFKSAHMAMSLAERCGCSVQTIYSIWRKNTWAKPRPNYGPNRERKAA